MNYNEYAQASLKRTLMNVSAMLNFTVDQIDALVKNDTTEGAPQEGVSIEVIEEEIHRALRQLQQARGWYECPSPSFGYGVNPHPSSGFYPTFTGPKFGQAFSGQFHPQSHFTPPSGPSHPGLSLDEVLKVNEVKAFSYAAVDPCVPGPVKANDFTFIKIDPTLTGLAKNTSLLNVVKLKRYNSTAHKFHVLVQVQLSDEFRRIRTPEIVEAFETAFEVIVPNEHEEDVGINMFFEECRSYLRTQLDKVSNWPFTPNHINPNA